MKIVNVDFVMLTSPWIKRKRSYGVVRVHTEEGRIGLGEPYCAVNMPLACREAIEVLKPQIVGQSAEDYLTLMQRLHWICEYFDHRGMIFCLLGAVDWALHDLAAQRARLPLHRMLNPDSADSVELYASTCSTFMTVPEAIEEFYRCQSLGFRTGKIRVGCAQQTVEEAIDRACAILREAPAGMRFGVDAGQQIFHEPRCWPLEHAQRLVAALAPFDIRFLEDPLVINDLEGYQALCRMEQVPIAGGEMFHDVETFQRYFEAGALHVGQPDACVVAGPQRCLQIGEIAARHDIPLVMHGWAGPVAQMQNIHAALAIENCDLVERTTYHHPLLEETIGALLKLDNGRMQAPSQPGMGVSLSDDILCKYAFEGLSAIIA